MLAQRESVTLRSLVAGTGLSTMAVYTYFDGMAGLWSAVRQEGFRHLAQRVSSVIPGRDPVRHLSALGVAYAGNALSNPNLFRVMFDTTFDLPDPDTAAETFRHLIVAAQAAIDAGRFSADHDAADIALRYWANGHGIVSLTVTGALTVEALRRHAPAMTAALFIDAGDSPARARRSVDGAWRDAVLVQPRTERPAAP